MENEVSGCSCLAPRSVSPTATVIFAFSDVCHIPLSKSPARRILRRAGEFLRPPPCSGDGRFRYIRLSKDDRCSRALEAAHTRHERAFTSIPIEVLCPLSSKKAEKRSLGCGTSRTPSPTARTGVPLLTLSLRSEGSTLPDRWVYRPRRSTAEREGYSATCRRRRDVPLRRRSATW